MTDTPHAFEARDVNFAYPQGPPVLRGVSFTATTGKLLCILGPNGSGKTTLLRCMLRQFKLDRGGLLLDGKEIERYSARELAKLVAYVPQTPLSAFAFSVQELVLMGRFAHGGALGLAAQEDLAVARLAMQMTQTLPFASRTLEELSGGEAQCVMIARALAQQPSVMLLDEPTSHLDIKNQLMIHKLMQRLAHDWGMAVICVSHEINQAAHFADELLLMRGGKVIAHGSPREVIRKETLQQVYDVEIDLIQTPGDDVPLVWAK